MRSRPGQAGQSTTETLLMMMFLLLLVFGLVHLTMLASTKLMVNFAAFSAARTAMIVPRGQQQGRAQAGAMSALQYLRWSPAPIARLRDGRRYRGKVRNGVEVRYLVPFGLPIYSSLPALGLQLVAFSPFAPQPDIPEVGDNAAR